MRMAQKERWKDKRDRAEAKALEKVEQKTAEAVADNAVVLERIKGKLLNRLEQMVDAYPETQAAEVRLNGDGITTTYRMRDLAAVYAALEEKTLKASVDIEDLSPLAALLKDDAE